MSDDKPGPTNDNVEPTGRGKFFALDRRCWAKVCGMSLNAAVAYLVLARGTLRDMRTTAWSAKSIEDRTSIPWRKAKEAVQALVDVGLIRRDKGGQHPRYYILPAHEVPGLVPGAKLPPLEQGEIELVRRLEGEPAFVPKVGRRDGADWARVSSNPYEVAKALVRKGVLVDQGGQTFALAKPPVDDAPDWIWLPVEIVDGAAGETAPVELIRQSANLAALRLFGDLYHAQSLNDHGGVHWRHLRQGYERHEIGARGSYVVWGFRAESNSAWARPLVYPHLTGKNEMVTRADGSSSAQDTGWPIFWKALEILTSTGLVEMVGHVINADTDEGTVIHPYAIGNGEPGEQAIADAAHLAGHAMLNDAKRELASANNLWLLPIRNHIRDVQLVGLARLRYRAKTKATAAWMSSSTEWAEWAQRYVAACAEAMGVSPDVDIKGISMAHQRKINGESMGNQRQDTIPY